MPPGPHPGFNKNIFINCPFDGQYNPLLRPILFTIVYLGFSPQIASQTGDSGEQRINKILTLILRSRYSIHDLSRIRSQRRGEFFRLNIPFELGIDYGCRRVSTGYLQRKKFLVFGAKPHDYRRALSDLGGVDAKSHCNQPKKAVIELRNWFVDTIHLKKVPSGSVLWEKFIEFRADFYDQRKQAGFSRHDLRTMPVREYIASIRHWLKTHG